MYSKNKKVIAFDPYLNNFGGGEKYFFDLLDVLSKSGLNVTVLIQKPYIKSEVKSFILQRFGYSLSERIKITQIPFSNKFLKYFYIVYRTVFCNYFITVTNEFPLFTLCKNSVCILQYPYIKNNLISKIRKNLHYPLYKNIIVYSGYVKNCVKRVGINSKITVISPYIDWIKDANICKKENKIICVGRFIDSENSKGQEYAIDFYKNIIKSNKFPDLELHLIGGAVDINSNYIKNLKVQAQGYKIFFHINAPNKVKNDLYCKSKIYWHLAGYKKDLVKNPGEAEHFGITVLEAIKYGAVPLCFNAGGPIEILRTSTDFLWNDEDELMIIVLKSLKTPKDRIQEKVSSLFTESAELYSRENFRLRISTLFR